MAPIVVGLAAKSFGWRWGMFLPGTIGLVVGAAVLFAVKDNPEMLKFPPVEAPVEEVCWCLHQCDG